MKIILWVLSILMAFGFAYTMQFTISTLTFGKELSDTDSATGFQDAITPPWQTNLALVTYFCCAVVVGVMWWFFGWASALGSAAIIFFGSSIAKLFLPKPTGNHYKKLIIQSMCSRYAGFIKSGDPVRADAMKQLLIKAGINPDEMQSA